MRDLLVTALVFGALPFIFRYAWFGVVVWTWLAYMNPHRQTWGFAYDFPFSLTVALVTLTALLLSAQKKEMIWTRETAVWALFLGWMFFTTFFAFYPTEAWMQWDKVWKIQLMFVVAMLLIRERYQLEMMIWTIAVSLGYYGFKGGIFTLLTGGQFHVVGPAGTFFGGNNEMALTLIMVIPLMRYLHLQATRSWVKAGLLAVMLMSAVAAIGTQSRGALLALVSMALFMWLKSRQKLFTGTAIAAAAVIVALVMPQTWYERMESIKAYEQDDSALGRLNAWQMAWNLAQDNVAGGGFESFRAPSFQQYAPEPERVHDAHSVYFEILGEHGFIGLGLFLLLGALAWLRAAGIIRAARDDPGKKWAADLAAMIQVSLVGYATGGAFLGLAYFDLPYHMLAILLITARITGMLDKPVPVAVPSFNARQQT